MGHGHALKSTEYEKHTTMQLHTIRSIAAAAALVLAAGGAQALTFQGVSVGPGTTIAPGTSVENYSGVGLLSFDVDFAGFAPVTLRYGVEAGDGSSVDFSAVLRNIAGGIGFDGYSLALSGGSFATLGSVQRQFAGSATVGGGGGLATVAFDSPEFLDVEIGNALGTTPGAMNWTVGGLAAGTTLELTLTPVPEPGPLALLLAGLGVVAFMSRHRRG